jgi:agmatine/peptidylarginine deiminase
MHPVEYRLPAEWEPQAGLLLAWPAPNSDWHDVLDAIRDEYTGLIEAAVARQPVVLLVPPGDDSARHRLGRQTGIEYVEARYDDTWCRDYGPVVMCHAGARLALDFRFDGWGGKHEARRDDRVNTLLARHPLFEEFEFRQSLFEIEGGAIDCDGNGTLLFNRHCLRARHPHLDDAEVDHELGAWFNATCLLEIDMPPLPGDDTDGHVDTLARFVDGERIAFQTLADAAATRRLAGQLELLRRAGGRPYELIALPAPHDVDGSRPASYANFVLINDAVLVPRYGSRADDEALAVLADAFPGREAVAVDARTLISQGGGPHCACMHIPAALA